MLVLGLLNLIIFFQGASLNDRLGNIATILIAYVGLIGVMQGTIKSNQITIT